MGPFNSFVYIMMLILAAIGALLLVFALFADARSGLASTGVGSLTIAVLCFIYLWFAGGVMEVPDE